MFRISNSPALASALGAMLLVPLVLSIGHSLGFDLPVPVGASASSGIVAGQA